MSTPWDDVHLPIIVFDPGSQPRYVARCTCRTWLRRRAGYDGAHDAWREHSERMDGVSALELWEARVRREQARRDQRRLRNQQSYRRATLRRTA